MPEFEFEPVYRDIFPFWDTIPEEKGYTSARIHIRLLFQRGSIFTMEMTALA